MDKFFIQAAFKTLDDIDKEENKEIKKALIESRLKEAKKRNKRSYIKKVAEDDFEAGKTFDIDDFSQFKKLCKEDGYIVTREDFDFYFNCLDEIRENNLYPLDEAKKKKTEKYPLGKEEHLNTCAGDPDVNTAAFNHATTLNTGATTTTLGESDEENNYKIKKYGRWHYIIINPENNLALRAGSNVDYSKPQSADNKILFFKNKEDAEKYIQDNLTNKEKLEEKIPKELKKAYDKTDLSLYAKRMNDDIYKSTPKDPDDEIKQKIMATLGDKYLQKKTHLKLTPIDFENAEYKIITKEEAHKYEKPRNRWHLVLLFTDGYSMEYEYPQAIRFDKQGKALSKILFVTNRYNGVDLPKSSISSVQLPTSTLIDMANVVYYTDELDHINDNYFTDLSSSNSDDKKDIIDTINDFGKYPWNKRTREHERALRSLRSLIRDIPGASSTTELNRKSELINQIDYEKDRLRRAKRFGYKDVIRQRRQNLSLLQRLLDKDISPEEYRYLNQINRESDPNDRDRPLSAKLSKVILLKALLDDKIKEFKEKAPDAETNTGFTKSEEYKKHQDRVKYLESQIQQLEKELDDAKKELSSLDTDQLNKEYNERVDNLMKDIEELNSKLVSYGMSSVLKEDIQKTKFNLKDPEDIEEAKKKKSEKEPEEDLVIIHPMLNHKKPHPGDAILTCEDCGEVFYFDKKELKQDEQDPKIYNKDIQCENCGAQDGYDYVGDVALKDTESAEEAIRKRESSLKDDFEEDSSTKLEPVDNTEEPEEIMEESFDKLVNKYLNKIYENITSYKTTSITQTDRNTYLIEGVFNLDNKKELKTSFLLESVEKNNNVFVLKGSNKILCEDKEPFEIKGKVDNKKLIFESFKYNYVETIGKEQYLVEGLEENK